MQQLDDLNDYRIGAWMERGLLTRAARAISDQFARAAGAAALAAASAVALPSHLIVSPSGISTVLPWMKKAFLPDYAMNRFLELHQRISDKLDRFGRGDRSQLDMSLLEEARLSLAKRT